MRNQNPSASFTFQPSAPSVGQQILFDATSSFDPDGTIASYDWDFGDGSAGSLAILNHSFASEGNFTVVLAVTDNLGARSTVQKNVEIFPPPPFTNNPPVANFTLAPEAPRVGQLILFDTSGSYDNDPGDRISLYRWNFGDGATNETVLPNTTHRYASEGVFLVVLTVNDSLSPQLDATVQKMVVMGPPAASSFTAYVPYVAVAGAAAIMAVTVYTVLRTGRKDSI